MLRLLRRSILVALTASVTLVGTVLADSGTSFAVLYTVSLSASPTTLNINNPSRLTATTNLAANATFATQIFDQGSHARVAQCTTGKSCAVNVTQSTAGGHSYIAYVARPNSGYPPTSIQATSNTVTVTWQNPQPPPPMNCVCQSITVGLAAGVSVPVDNLSDYPNSRVDTIVKYADRGMATTNAFDMSAKGLMHAGDKVIVTHYGIFWIDLVARGGLLGGMWAVRPDVTGNMNFKYIANGSNWGPNYLMPGSRGFLSGDTGIAGLNSLTVPCGGADGSTIFGKGTFTPFGAPISTFSASIQGSDHLYQVVGTLTQEFYPTQPQTTVVDCNGHQAAVNYVLTYRFRPPGDLQTDYNGTNVQPRTRMELSLTPNAAISLNNWSFDTDSQFDTAPYGLMSHDYRSDTRTHFGGANCAGSVYGPFSVGSLCASHGDATNFVMEDTQLPSPRISEGSFATFGQNTRDANDREYTFLLPIGQGFTTPIRISSVHNQGLSSLSMEAQYFNNARDPAQNWPAGLPQKAGLDLQMEPF